MPLGHAEGGAEGAEGGKVDVEVDVEVDAEGWGSDDPSFSVDASVDLSVDLSGDMSPTGRGGLWHSRRDEAGATYYVNERTLETRWEPPAWAQEVRFGGHTVRRHAGQAEQAGQTLF